MYKLHFLTLAWRLPRCAVLNRRCPPNRPGSSLDDLRTRCADVVWRSYEQAVNYGNAPHRRPVMADVSIHGLDRVGRCSANRQGRKEDTRSRYDPSWLIAVRSPHGSPILAIITSAALLLCAFIVTGCGALAGDSAGSTEPSRSFTEFDVLDACTSEPVVGATIEVVSKVDCARTVVAHTNEYGEATARVESDSAMILVCAEYYECVSISVLPSLRERSVNLPKWSIR